MKKYPFISILTLALLGLAAVSYAQTLKVITLKDGSVLKGKVLQLKDDIYTVETSNLGSVDVPESDVLGITSPEAIGSQHQQSGESGGSKKAQLKSQVQQVQGSIMADQELMGDIQNILEDEEVKAILSDPKLLNDVMSFDEDKIQQNDSVQDLLNNPKMRDLMNKVQQKLPAQK